MKCLIILAVLCSSLGFAQQTPQQQDTGDLLDNYVASATNIANFFSDLIKDQQGTCIYGDCQNSFGISNLPHGGQFRGNYTNGIGGGFSQIDSKDGSYIVFSNYVFGTGFKNGFMLMLGKEDKPYVFLDYHAEQGIGFYPEHKMYGSFTVVDGQTQDPIGIQPTGEDVGCVGGDCYNGAGVYRHNNNSTYTGYFKDGQRHGVGEMWYSQGVTYWGQWVYGKKEGQGIMVWSEHKYYFGEWKDDRRNGQGIIRLTQDSYQAGTWVNDSFQATNNTQSSPVNTAAVNTTPSRDVSPLSATDQQTILGCNGDKKCLIAAYTAKYQQLDNGDSKDLVMQKLADYLVGQDVLIPQKTLGVIMASSKVPLVINYLPENLRARLRQEAQGIAVNYNEYIKSEETKKAVEAAGGRLIKD